jgi:RimJ/RimL family protein N-acetyltransferase
MTALLTHVPVIETERLTLRGWDESDFPTIAALFADEDTMRFLGGVMDAPTAWRAVATQIGHWAMRGYGFFALEEKSTGACIGWCGPWFPHGWPDKEIGWSLAPEARGKGYATEAAEAIAALCLYRTGLELCHQPDRQDNTASIAVADPAGCDAANRRTSPLPISPAIVYRHQAGAGVSQTRRLSHLARISLFSEHIKISEGVPYRWP